MKAIVERHVFEQGISRVLLLVSLTHTDHTILQDAGITVNTERYKRQLKEKEQALLGQLTRAGKLARESGDDSTRDAGDESVAGEQKDEQFRASHADWITLGQVREALRRIDDGTFGACRVDGERIEEKRLEAIPWTAYCLRHQQEIEDVEASRRPTL
jgi:DnaK suppressor protein